VPRHLSLGLYALVPYRAFTQAHSFFVDEHEQFYTNSLHPEMYSDRLTPVSLAFAVGGQLTDWLSIGVSFTLSLKNRANALAYVGNSADVAGSLKLSTHVDVNTGVSPHGSVLLTPLDDLDIALTVHSPQKLSIETDFGIYLPNGDLQYASRPATHDYMPWILGLGVNYDVVRAGRSMLSLVLSTTYERWSQYVNRQSERPLPGYEFKDVWTGTAGVRSVRDDSLGFLLDVTYHPTPVPLQTGRTNYVDNNRIGFVLGTSYDMPLTAWKLALRFGAQAQLHVLPRRSQAKLTPSRADRTASDVRDEWDDATVDIRTNAVAPEAAGLQTNNAGYPGFSSEGMVLGGTLSTALLY
jgi:long-chain fatty acid transport protein